MFNTPHWPTLVTVAVEADADTWLARVFDLEQFTDESLPLVTALDVLRIEAPTFERALTEVDRVLGEERFTLHAGWWSNAEPGHVLGPTALATFMRAAVN